MVILADPDLKLWESSMGICQAPGVGFLPMFFPRILENFDKIIFSLILLLLFTFSKMAENGFLTKYDDPFVKFQSIFKRKPIRKLLIQHWRQALFKMRPFGLPVVKNLLEESEEEQHGKIVFSSIFLSIKNQVMPDPRSRERNLSSELPKLDKHGSKRQQKKTCNSRGITVFPRCMRKVDTSKGNLFVKLVISQSGEIVFSSVSLHCCYDKNQDDLYFILISIPFCPSAARRMASRPPKAQSRVERPNHSGVMLKEDVIEENLRIEIPNTPVC